MYVSRLIVRNFRNCRDVDLRFGPRVTCVVGENNVGKTNLVHALRIVLDNSLPLTARRLEREDLSAGLSFSGPEQVLIAVEFRDFVAVPTEHAMVATWAIGDDTARLAYRFRPTPAAREGLTDHARTGESLTLEDYRWEFSGGGPGDPLAVAWNEDLGHAVRWDDLQHFLVVLMHPLRDVDHALRQSRYSPLGKILEATTIPAAEKAALVDHLSEANARVAQSDTIARLGNNISASLDETAGVFSMRVDVGMAEPTFASLSRSLSLLLSSHGIERFDTSRNGLGLNNALFVSMLLNSFELRRTQGKTAGQLLIVEEPEAHLHPQLQRLLFGALQGKPFQTIATTHSTHITSQLPLGSLVVMTNDGSPAAAACIPAAAALLSAGEIADLERYLDATRATLLFARRVMLVEGPAELFLIPALVKHVLGISLEEHGISVIPIFGVHFGAYSRLFGQHAMPKKCAVVADADLKPSDAGDVDDADLPAPTPPDLAALESDHVRAFAGTTTFERELTSQGTIEMLARTALELGATQVGARLRAVLQQDPNAARLNAARDLVLKTAIRFGKARFAQVASKHASAATAVPQYIEDAVQWLLQ